MATNETFTWTGGSGQKYVYTVFQLPVSLNPDQVGTYIFAKRDGERWRAIYVGQGDLRERCRNHHQSDCIIAKGATHFHCRLVPDESARRQEEADVLAANPTSYAPIGCNEKVGG